jgi:hypothetical protein
MWMLIPLGPASASPSWRRCACSGWWPARGSRRWCSATATIPGPRPAQTACAAGGATGWRDVEAATSFALDHGATGRTLPLLVLPVPAPLTATAKAVAGVRYALDWRRLDYHRMAPVAD